MNIDEAIRTRRTILRFREDPVHDGLLDEVLGAGIWAQNHRLTQPWRFTVLGPETHRALAEINAEQQTGTREIDDGVVMAARESARQKLLSKPRIVVVTQQRMGDEFQLREDYAATCCAIQIIQLAAWARGLGMQWSTNKLTRLPEVYRLLGCDPADGEIVAFLYFGYPAEVPKAPARKPLREVLRRLP
jgi:nitroreductase